MNSLVIASLTPRLLDIHGDAQNAQVLATRARWAGHEAEVVPVDGAADAAGLRLAAVVIGSGFDFDALEVLAALESFADSLHEWVAAGAPLLAVGLGWELLSVGTELERGSALPGLGVFSGRFVPSERRSGQVVLDSAWGRLLGYEYHYRDYLLGPDEQPLGAVRSGVGNVVQAAGARAEGVQRAHAFGTMQRGPILARNPRFADALLAGALGDDASSLEAASDAQRAADEYAERANRRVLDALGI